MRALVWVGLLGLAVLAGCDGGQTSSDNAGGGGDGGSATTGGAGGTTSETTGETTTDTGTTSETTSMTTTSTTTMVVDACETAGSEPVLFGTDVQPIFSQSCGNATSCHLKSLPSEGLSLKPGEAYGALVDVAAKQSCEGKKRVAPGSAVESYLVNKITATGVCPTTKKMPPSSTLSAANKQKIIDWICQGAQDN
ncbi:MAG: hypothetical protein R3B70_07550 [Polyangiaceae bacterium]